MPKIKIEFDLPEDQQEYELYINGPNYSCIIEDVDNYLRSMIKYPLDGMTEAEIERMQVIRNMLREEE